MEAPTVSWLSLEWQARTWSKVKDTIHGHAVMVNHGVDHTQTQPHTHRHTHTHTDTDTHTPPDTQTHRATQPQPQSHTGWGQHGTQWREPSFQCYSIRNALVSVPEVARREYQHTHAAPNEKYLRIPACNYDVRAECSQVRGNSATQPAACRKAL